MNRSGMPLASIFDLWNKMCTFLAIFRDQSRVGRSFFRNKRERKGNQPRRRREEEEEERVGRLRWPVSAASAPKGEIRPSTGRKGRPRTAACAEHMHVGLLRADRRVLANSRPKGEIRPPASRWCNIKKKY